MSKNVAWAIFAICVMCGVWCVNRAIQAEKTFHAERLVMDLVCSFVEQEKRWPQNWEQLRRMAPSKQGMWIWPDEISDIRKRVEINFEYDLGRVEEETIESFDGIMPRGVSYLHHDDWLMRLKKWQKGEREEKRQDMTENGTDEWGQVQIELEVVFSSIR